MRRSRILPFRFTPTAWSLSGQPYDEAELSYYYEGEELEVRLAKLRNVDATALAKALLAIDLKYGNVDKYQFDMRSLEIEGRGRDERAVLDIDFSHRKIDEYQYGRRIIEIEMDGVERDVALLDLDLNAGKIDTRAHAKAVATAKDEPWVGVVNDAFNFNLGVDGFAIELDWNEKWIEYLRWNGYGGQSEADIVDAWFVDVCREQTDADVSFGEPAMFPQSSAEVYPRRRPPQTRFRQ